MKDENVKPEEQDEEKAEGGDQERKTIADLSQGNIFYLHVLAL